MPLSIIALIVALAAGAAALAGHGSWLRRTLHRRVAAAEDEIAARVVAMIGDSLATREAVLASVRSEGAAVRTHVEQLHQQALDEIRRATAPKRPARVVEVKPAAAAEPDPVLELVKAPARKTPTRRGARTPKGTGA